MDEQEKIDIIIEELGLTEYKSYSVYADWTLQDWQTLQEVRIELSKDDETPVNEKIIKKVRKRNPTTQETEEDILDNEKNNLEHVI